jgi:uncharacterized protein
MSTRGFGVAYGVTLLGLAAAYELGGVRSATVVAMLAILEVALSFDNAVVNATVLRRFNEFWQRIFLSVGIVIAVLGMRLVIPIIVLVAATGKSPAQVLSRSISDPNNFGHEISRVQPMISAFGGVFLMMIFMDFLLSEHDRVWLRWIEAPLARVSERYGEGRRLITAQVVGVVAFLGLAAATFGREHPVGVPFAGLIGLTAYLVISRLGGAAADKSTSLAGHENQPPPVGRQALMLFVYLEILDATFSFDSVMGGFSVTADVALFTIGLGIGAAYVRCLTVYLVRKETLDQYVYLEHGAYYSIGVLAILLLVQIWHDVPDWFASLAGTSMIVVAYLHSMLTSKKDGVIKRQQPG